MNPGLLARIALTHILSLGGAWVCVLLHTPVPWFMGPLLVTGAVSLMGVSVASPVAARNAAQSIIGMALGLYFTSEIAGLVIGLWWAIALSVAWAMALGWAFGWWLHTRHTRHFGGTRRHQWATAFFSGAIGGANEMSILAEREGGRPDLVAAAHTVRVLLVALVVPFAFTFSGLHAIALAPAHARDVHWDGLLTLAAAAGAGILLIFRLNPANAWFLGALGAAMGLTVAGVHLSAIPNWLTNAAQLVIGAGLGARFTPGFIHAAPRWIVAITCGSLALVLVSAGFGWMLAWGTGQHPGTMILGTAPAGIAEMAITAKTMQLGVPLVTALHVCRLLTVLLSVQPIFRHWYGRSDESQRETESGA